MGLLQELLNANEENMREILKEGWVLDWVERAREIDDYGFFQAFWFQLSSVHSFFSSPSSCRPPAQPGFEGHLHQAAQLPLAGGGDPHKHHIVQVQPSGCSGPWYEEEEASDGGSPVPEHHPGFLFNPVPFHLLPRLSLGPWMTEGGSQGADGSTSTSCS